MSEHAAPVAPSTIVVADVGKTTAAISATDTARHRLFGPVDITMTRSDLATLVNRLTDCFPAAWVTPATEIAAARHCEVVRCAVVFGHGKPSHKAEGPDHLVPHCNSRNEPQPTRERSSAS
ncbi:hypothetical protein R3Q06_28905 [Rhodococcus erythropolis]|uniref:hypothetical protein n=1 Tax=Rhodococcus erythropolis TaxID=1833 RepID=UPI00294A2661|nr:hypothetical protein [Rhodococcus erythropolis]MDV6277517.1 hypothetical protein [Rhodococcus erythropolis]